MSSVKGLSTEEVVQNINGLKTETVRFLSQLPDKLEVEVNKFKEAQNTSSIKELELREIYDIDKSAATPWLLSLKHNRESGRNLRRKWRAPASDGRRKRSITKPKLKNSIP